MGKHLHVPLQSGDDDVLHDMARRYTAQKYLARVAPLQDEFNLTTDVIVGFPTENERAFRNTLDVVAEAGITKVHVFPYSPRPGTVTAARDSVPAAVAHSNAYALAAKVGSEDLVLVDRPGRGYGDDYSPWFVDAPVGELVRVRAADVSEEGILAA